jgi:hypothetical protein
LKKWIAIFKYSVVAKFRFQEKMDQAVWRYCKTRWWTWFEVMSQVAALFPLVKEFLEENCNSICQESMAGCLKHYDSGVLEFSLRLEIAATTDGALPLVQATYNLEGDSALACRVYPTVKALLNTNVNEQLLRSASAVIREQHPDLTTPAAVALLERAKACVQPAYDYLRRRFVGVPGAAATGDMADSLEVYRVCQLVDPGRAAFLDDFGAMLDVFDKVPGIKSDYIDGLKRERPHYLYACTGVSATVDPLAFWKAHKKKLPLWFEAARNVFFLTPSVCSR